MEAIKVLIWLEPTDEGGRQSGIWAGYRPHLCVIDCPHDSQGLSNYMGVWALEICNADGANCIMPSENGQAIFQLLYFNADKPQSVELYAALQPGREFEIREGSNTIGTVCVQSRIND